MLELNCNRWARIFHDDDEDAIFSFVCRLVIAVDIARGLVFLHGDGDEASGDTSTTTGFNEGKLVTTPRHRGRRPTYHCNIKLWLLLALSINWAGGGG